MSVWQRLAERFGTATVMRALNLYPPYIGAGIRVHPSADGKSVTSSMRLTALNRNYVGTHFGGSLYAMCDPFFALLLAARLGPSYLVLDKSAAIRFVKLGTGRVSATFAITDDEVRTIERTVGEKRKAEPVYRARVLDEAGDVVAEMDKTI